MELERTIELDATVEEVWELVADPAERRAWVGAEADGAVVTEVVDGARLAWRWHDGDGAPESTVEVTVGRSDDGDRTRVIVVERRPAPSGGGGGGAARACSRWDDRLVGLELGALVRRFSPAAVLAG